MGVKRDYTGEVVKLQKRIETFDRAILKLAKNPGTYTDVEIADLVVALDLLRRTISDTDRSAKTILSDILADREEVRASNGTMVEKTWSKPRKAWRHDDLRGKVKSRVRDLSTDFDTGEVLLTNDQQIDAVLNCGHIDYWRVKALAALDIDADSYCDAGESVPSISVKH